MDALVMNENKSNVLIHILWNKMPDEDANKVCEKIKYDLDKIEGVKESFVTEGSEISDIAAFAEWKEHDIKNNIEKIRRIANIKSVEAKILVPA
jgi:hypothetical protein